MSSGPTDSSSSPSPPSISPSQMIKSTSVMMARVVGILCVAAGFMLGIQGLDEPDSVMLPTALGLIAAGLVAQVFALVRSYYVFSRRRV